MTDEEIGIAATEYANTVHWGVAKADFIQGAMWVKKHMEEELKIAIRDKDMAYMAYKAVQEQLKDKQ